MQKIAVEESRMKIPMIYGCDVIHGHRTVYPLPLASAAAFNDEKGEYIVEAGEFYVFVGENCLTKNQITIKVK